MVNKPFLLVIVLCFIGIVQSEQATQPRAEVQSNSLFGSNPTCYQEYQFCCQILNQAPQVKQKFQDALGWAFERQVPTVQEQAVWRQFIKDLKADNSVSPAFKNIVASFLGEVDNKKKRLLLKILVAAGVVSAIGLAGGVLWHLNGAGKDHKGNENNLRMYQSLTKQSLTKQSLTKQSSTNRPMVESDDLIDEFPEVKEHRSTVSPLSPEQEEHALDQVEQEATKIGVINQPIELWRDPQGKAGKELYFRVVVKDKQGHLQDVVSYISGEVRLDAKPFRMQYIGQVGFGSYLNHVIEQIKAPVKHANTQETKFKLLCEGLEARLKVRAPASEEEKAQAFTLIDMLKSYIKEGSLNEAQSFNMSEYQRLTREMINQTGAAGIGAGSLAVVYDSVPSKTSSEVAHPESVDGVTINKESLIKSLSEYWLSRDDNSCDEVADALSKIHECIKQISLQQVEKKEESSTVEPNLTALDAQAKERVETLVNKRIGLLADRVRLLCEDNDFSSMQQARNELAILHKLYEQCSFKEKKEILNLLERDLQSSEA